MKFADYLYCSGDFLRASEEYNSVLQITPHNDTVRLRIVLSLMHLKKWDPAYNALKEINTASIGVSTSLINYKLLFLSGDTLRFTELQAKMQRVERTYPAVTGLRAVLYFPPEEVSLQPYNAEQQLVITRYLVSKKKREAYSPYLAATLSIFVPGAGRVYAGNWAEGLSSAILTGILTYSAVKNRSSAAITGSFAVWFYLSDIYGSFIGAKVKNRKLRDENEETFHRYLEERNFFIPAEIEGICPPSGK